MEFGITCRSSDLPSRRPVLCTLEIRSVPSMAHSWSTEAPHSSTTVEATNHGDDATTKQQRVHGLLGHLAAIGGMAIGVVRGTHLGVFVASRSRAATRYVLLVRTRLRSSGNGRADDDKFPEGDERRRAATDHRNDDGWYLDEQTNGRNAALSFRQGRPNPNPPSEAPHVAKQRPSLCSSILPPVTTHSLSVLLDSCFFPSHPSQRSECLS